MALYFQTALVLESRQRGGIGSSSARCRTRGRAAGASQSRRNIPQSVKYNFSVKEKLLARVSPGSLPFALLHQARDNPRAAD
jgi:hypothetical protein